VEALTPWHVALIAMGFIVLFGYKKLPDAAHSLGRSLTIFKSEMREATGRGDAGADASSPADELDRQAAQAEAQAAELRSRAAAAQRVVGG
jgi:sec-independent protein translocase protein TatA